MREPAMSNRNSQSRTIRVDVTRRVVVRGPTYWGHPSQRYGVRVFAERADDVPGGWSADGEAETMWGTERYDTAARNKLGLLGAYCDVPPTHASVDAAIDRALARLGAAGCAYTPSWDYAHPIPRAAKAE